MAAACEDCMKLYGYCKGEDCKLRAEKRAGLREIVGVCEPRSGNCNHNSRNFVWFLKKLQNDLIFNNNTRTSHWNDDYKKKLNKSEQRLIWFNELSGHANSPFLKSNNQGFFIN